MQVRAIMEAACELAAKKVKVVPEIMIPLVGHVNELKVMRELTIKIAEEVRSRFKTKVDYKVGTMIELPRACITSDEIATQADFYSFGTNDLTQTTYGLSRDDAGKFLPSYIEWKIITDDPFVTIDQEGVGALMKIATEKGRSVKKNLKLGICGEHGGDPASVEFCHRIGLDYVKLLTISYSDRQTGSCAGCVTEEQIVKKDTKDEPGRSILRPFFKRKRYCYTKKVMSIVAAKKLVKDYGNFRAVDSIDFEIAQGEFFGFLGPNGAGKTTVMRVIYCFMPPTSGDVRIFGLDVIVNPSKIKAKIGVMPQENNLDPDLSVLENLVVYARYFDIPKKSRFHVPGNCSILSIFGKKPGLK